MNLKLKLLLIISVVAFSGCAKNWNDPVQVQHNVKVVPDEFKKITMYKGPDLAPVHKNLYIRAWKRDNTSTIDYQIYIRDYYGGKWRFYREANDSDGNKLSMTKILKEVGSCDEFGCSFYEHVGINVNHEYLTSHISSGIRLKLSGKRGSAVFKIPGLYIQGFLAAIPQS